MKLQIVQDSKGNNSGVFIPIEDWKLIISTYPDIEKTDEEIPDWQKTILNQRMNELSANPENIVPIEQLYKFLDSEI